MPKKVLILNGSPKGNNSSTFKATKAFVEGIILADSSYEAEYVCEIGRASCRERV